MTGAGAAARGGPALLLPALGLLAFAAYAVLLLTDPALYAAAIDPWSFGPTAWPFIDVEGPLAWVRAWHQGVDVYLSAPAGAHGWKMNYSPLLLRLPLPFAAAGSGTAYGLAIDGLFLVSLSALPRPRATADQAAMVLALFSPLCVFGIERANLDLLIFATMAFAALCLSQGLAVRLLGYAAILAAGLLKFYPLVVLAGLIRERRAVLVPACVAIAAILAAFVLAFRGELGRIGANLPLTNPFRDAFGASQIPIGLVLLLRPWHAGGARWDVIEAAIWAIGTVALYGAGLARGLALARGPALGRRLGRLTAREANCLLLAALVLGGCFFAGTSIGYRAVFLLLALPGILALSRVADDHARRPRARLVVAASLGVLWSLPVQRVVAATFGPLWVPGQGAAIQPVGGYVAGTAVWLLREAMWWWIVTFLVAVAARMLWDGRGVAKAPA